MKPRLWTTEISAAAVAVQTHCPKQAETAIRRANQICDHIFLFQDHWEMERTSQPVQFGQTVDWNALPNDDPEWLYALNRHTIFVNLPKAWRFTGKQCYLDTFCALLDDWLCQVPLTPQSESTTWRSLEAGLRAESWLRALLLFGDAVPSALRTRATHSLHQHGVYLAKAYGAFHTLSNWGAIQEHGLFLIGLWCNRSDWQTLALQRLECNLRHAVMADGVQWEQNFHFGDGTLTQQGNTVVWQGGHTTAQLCFLGGQMPTLHTASRAPQYNNITTGPALRLTAQTKGTTPLPFVLRVGGQCQAQLISVETASGLPLAPNVAQGIRLQTEQQEYTLILVHQPGAHEAAVLCAGGHTGHGEVLVFTKDGQIAPDLSTHVHHGYNDGKEQSL